MSSKVQSDVKEEKKRGHTGVQWLMVLMACTSMLAYGMETGWISPTTKILQSELSPTGYPLSDQEISWVGGVMPLVAACGVPLYSYIADAYGRKNGILAVVSLQVLSWAVRLVATNFPMLILSRVLGGLPAGGCFNVVPVYVREISQDSIRGTVVSMCLLMQNFGLFVMYTIGSYMDYTTVLWISIAVPIVGTVSLCFAPESPQFLVKRDKIEEATKTVAFLRGLDVTDSLVKSEVNDMQKSELHFKSLPQITFYNIFKNKSWRCGFILIMTLLSAQAMNGNYTIMTFAWKILSSTGIALNPDLQSLVVPILLTCGSVVSILCVERIGRKPILVTSYVLTTLAMAGMGTVLLLQEYDIHAPGWVSIAAIATSVWSYSAGVTPCFYVVLSELFNFQIRGKLIGCVVTYGWVISSIQLMIFAPISTLLGTHSVFYIYACINLCGSLISLVLIPETKGKSVEEIEEILGK